MNPLAKNKEAKKQGIVYMHHPTDRVVHTMIFVTPVVEHWLEQEIAHCSMGPRIANKHHEQTLHHRAMPHSQFLQESLNHEIGI